MSSRETSESEKDAIQRYRPEQEGTQYNDLTKQASRGSELKKVPSNTLGKVASRLTTRDIVDPGPPPDGGTKAWIQVAMGWVVCVCTWYVREPQYRGASKSEVGFYSPRPCVMMIVR